MALHYSTMQNEGQLSTNLLLTAVYNRSKAGEKQ